MPHHRSVHSVSRPRAPPRKLTASDDAIITILEYLDPASLYNACKGLSRFRRLVFETMSLRYKFTLAIACMKDGPVSHRRMPLYKRHQFLSVFQQHWSMLQSTQELTLQFNLPAIVGVSGRFIYEIQNHGVFNVLNMFELPSSTMNVAPSQVKPFQCPEIEHVAVDSTQSLILSCHAYILGEQISVKVHFRDMRTQAAHGKAFQPLYDLSTGISAQLVRMAATICGSRLLLMLEWGTGKIQHLLMDWHRFQARWLKDSDLHFIDERTLLGITRSSDGMPTLAVYDLPEVPMMGIKAQFLLPAEWKHQHVDFAKSGTPRWDARVSSNALVIPSPEWSTVVLVVKPQAGLYAGGNQKWCAVLESFFRFLPRRKATTVVWKEWAHVCTPILNVTPDRHVVSGPLTMGSKVVFLDAPAENVKAKRLCVLDLSPFQPFEHATDTKAGQQEDALRARKMGNFPETRRSLSSKTEDVEVGEDSIVLISSDNHHHPTRKIVQVLQLGKPA